MPYSAQLLVRPDDLVYPLCRVKHLLSEAFENVQRRCLFRAWKAVSQMGQNPLSVLPNDGHRYSESYISEPELETLPSRTRDQVRRAAQNAQQIYGAPGGWGGGGLFGAA